MAWCARCRDHGPPLVTCLAVSRVSWDGAGGLVKEVAACVFMGPFASLECVFYALHEVLNKIYL